MSACDEHGVCYPPNNDESKGGDEQGKPTSNLVNGDDKEESKDSKNDDIKWLELDVQIISDTMCPWCWVGKRHLEAAIEQEQQSDSEVQMNVAVEWLPYFLDKKLPENGKPVHDYYRDNYGNPSAGEEMKPYLIDAGAKVGIDFATTYAKLTHYRPTVQSHRLIEYVKKHHPTKQNDIVEALFQMYYIEGKHLNCIEHLCYAAQSIGLEYSKVQTFLQSSEGTQEVYDTAQSIRHLAHGVPTFIIQRRQLEGESDKQSNERPIFVSGAASPVTFRKRLQRLKESL